MNFPSESPDAVMQDSFGRSMIPKPYYYCVCTLYIWCLFSAEPFSELGKPTRPKVRADLGAEKQRSPPNTLRENSTSKMFS